MNAYTPPGWGAIHLDGCTLDADHAGACLLARPFRIRPEGGREYLDRDDYGTRQDAEAFVREALGEWAAEYDVPALADALHEHAGRSWDLSRVPEETFWAVVKRHEQPVAEVLATDHELRAQMRAQRDAEGRDVPLLDSTDAAAAEVRWVAGEARALMADDDPERRARFVARKRALLAFIERTTGADQ